MARKKLAREQSPGSVQEQVEQVKVGTQRVQRDIKMRNIPEKVIEYDQEMDGFQRKSLKGKLDSMYKGKLECSDKECSSFC